MALSADNASWWHKKKILWRGSVRGFGAACDDIYRSLDMSHSCPSDTDPAITCPPADPLATRRHARSYLRIICGRPGAVARVGRPGDLSGSPPTVTPCPLTRSWWDGVVTVRDVSYRVTSGLRGMGGDWQVMSSTSSYITAGKMWIAQRTNMTGKRVERDERKMCRSGLRGEVTMICFEGGSEG